MPDLLIEIDQKKQLFGRTREIRLKCSLTPDPESPQEISSAILSDFIRILFEHAPQLLDPITMHTAEQQEETNGFLYEDLRGRPVETFPQNTEIFRELSREPNEEEMFHASGVVFELPKQLLISCPSSLPGDDSTLEQMPFSYSVRTRFHSFRGTRHIVHRIRSRCSGALKRTRPVPLIERLPHLIPMRIDKVRIGLEYFRSRFRGSMLSFAPAIERTFYLEASPGKIRFDLRDHISDASILLPLHDLAFLPALARALDKTELHSGFLTTLEELLKAKQAGHLRWSSRDAKNY